MEEDNRDNLGKLTDITSAMKHMAKAMYYLPDECSNEKESIYDIFEGLGFSINNLADKIEKQLEGKLDANTD